MTIVPDDKDWTWVLETKCAECGFNAGAVDARDVARMLGDASAAWVEVLTTRADVRQRPSPAVWSPLEYGCHVRDVCWVYVERVGRMLNEDGPHYLNWDQDATAVEQDYASQDPSDVAAELKLAARAMAERFSSVENDEWQRTGFRSDGAAFTIDTISRYFLHDVVHHLHDVGAA